MSAKGCKLSVYPISNTTSQNSVETWQKRLERARGKADVIIGPIGMVIADAMLGEITPAMAAEIASTYGIRVYTIGVGAMGTAPYPV